MANGFTESHETWEEGQNHKADVLKRGNELLEQNGEMERGTFSEAIGQDTGMGTATADRWVGQLSNEYADTATWRRATRGKKEYISFKPNAEAPRPACASATGQEGVPHDKPKGSPPGVRVRTTLHCKGVHDPSATDSKYCVWHGEPTQSRGKGGGNA